MTNDKKADCPICQTPAARKIPATPYHACDVCGCWFQDPMPPKLYQAPTEYDLETMPERDRQVNRELAAWLFANVMGGKPGRILDIGAKHPVLASALAGYGCEARAVDGVMPSEEPGVTCGKFDFESHYEQAILHAAGGQLHLITMIHVFEHMYDPLAALRKLRQLIEPDGRVFLRLPDHRVPGYERDLTEQHFKIHPYFHCLTSILEALAQVRDCFVIESTTAMVGAGQRDIVLKPITRAPTLAVAMIAKNEERDIGRAVRSFATIAQEFVLVDTGSTDKTVIVATTEWEKP